METDVYQRIRGKNKRKVSKMQAMCGCLLLTTAFQQLLEFFKEELKVK